MAVRWRPRGEPCLIPGGVLISSGASAWGPAWFLQWATETDKCGIGKKRCCVVAAEVSEAFGAALTPPRILVVTSE